MDSPDQSYDIIGDIHGHAEELLLLLEKLGYKMQEAEVTYSNGFHHPENRKLIFVGDLIDRGPEIRKVLQIVKGCVDSNNALCILGNHEYNAMGFWNKDVYGTQYLREHSHKNIIQHFQTIKAFQNREEEWEQYVTWFGTLPFYLDLPKLRVVHAYWDDMLEDEKFYQGLYFELGKPDLNWWLSEMQYENFTIHKTIGTVLKGHKINLPPGLTYPDKDGNTRTTGRTKWWLNPSGLTYEQYLEPSGTKCPELSQCYITDQEILNNKCGDGYPKTAKPIFFGHYWLRGQPWLQAPNVCCLDYSVAKGDKLVAYRFDGEQVLDINKFVTVDSLYRQSS